MPPEDWLNDAVDEPLIPQGEVRDGDWLEKVVARHGGEWPEVMTASLPGQISPTFPDAASAEAFCNEVNADGAFTARLYSEMRAAARRLCDPQQPRKGRE
jgi:hypothetical protein